MISTLRNLRIKRGITLRDLERGTGISNAYLSQLESGKARNPTLSKVRVLARFFNVDPFDLFAETIDTSKSYPVKDDTIIMEHSVGFSRATKDIHQGVSYQPGTAACGFDCHVDAKYGFVPEADCPVHDRKSSEATETITSVAAMTIDQHMEGFKGVFGSPDAFMAGELSGVGFEAETITSVAAMQLRAGSLFSEMIQGKIGGYRVEMDRSVHPAEFHITTWS